MPDMKPLWTTWRCRRNANVFLLTLAGLVISLLIVAILQHTGWAEHLLVVLPVIAVYLAIWGVRAISRARERPGESRENPPLSRDEWRKARSKLVKDRKET
jgi:membrane protein implicated in regulation of membrane protease activity